MSAAAKDVSASQDTVALEALAGPAMAAMVLPTTVMMGGFVAAWGFGMAFARAFGASVAETAATAPQPFGPRLVVSNPEPAEAAKPAPAKPAPAKPTGTPPKPSTPGGTPPKPKSAKAVAPKAVAPKAVAPKAVSPKAVSPKAISPKDAAPQPKAGAVKPPVDEKPVVANPVVAKPKAPPAGTDQTATVISAPVPAPKNAAAPKAKVPAPAAKPTKVVPTAAKPATIGTTSTAKGISLPKLSIQDKPDGKPGKD